MEPMFDLGYDSDVYHAPVSTVEEVKREQDFDKYAICVSDDGESPFTATENVRAQVPTTTTEPCHVRIDNIVLNKLTVALLRVELKA